MDTSAIRAANKSRRAGLSTEQVSAASVDVTASLWRQPFMSRSRRIAAYHAVGGEIDCRYFIESAWRRGREVYLPVIRSSGLAFAQYHKRTPILRNRYGIAEPVCTAAYLFEPGEMDVVLTPLVAFDNCGNRIGMGAGFYDRSFRFLRHRHRWRHPRLVGLAYEFQKTPPLKASGWDIPLHAVVTENRAYAFR
ncbi:MAG: 5-formyltetrahydrofolate cyclo-ligase [Gammaproteobacteria bacterium]